MTAESMEVDEKKPAAAGETKPKDEPKKPKDVDTVTLENLREHCRLLERADVQKETRYIGRVLRSLASTRKQLNANVLTRLINAVFTHQSVVNQRDQLAAWVTAAAVVQTSKDSMDVDVKSPKALLSRSPRNVRRGTTTGSLLPEIEVYIHLLVLVYLIDKNALAQAIECAPALLSRVDLHNRRTLDTLASKAYFYYTLANARANRHQLIIDSLNGCLRAVTMRGDLESEATLINCLLQLYLHLEMYEDAAMLVSHISFPESVKNNEWARYYYYLGRIKAVQRDYATAQGYLEQAIRKAPQHTAIGFKQKVNKFVVVVSLLIGDIPPRHLFRQQILKKPFKPYCELTQAVRLGDVQTFNACMKAYDGTVFEPDGTHSLIVRLHQNVIRKAVRQIALAYSRISLDDISKKLQLNSSLEADYIVNNIISDGGIDAKMVCDGECLYLQSNDPQDIYSTSQPQYQFDQRISYCLSLYNQAVKALRYPPDQQKNVETAEQQREREQQELEFAKELAEEEDDDY